MSNFMLTVGPPVRQRAENEQLILRLQSMSSASALSGGQTSDTAVKTAQQIKHIFFVAVRIKVIALNKSVHL